MKCGSTRPRRWGLHSGTNPAVSFVASRVPLLIESERRHFGAEISISLPARADRRLLRFDRCDSVRP